MGHMYIDFEFCYIFIVENQGYCQGFHDVLDVYNAITPAIRMSGPTSFAPVIHKSIEIVKASGDVSIFKQY